MVKATFIRFILAIVIPLVLIPVATIGGKEAKCAYVLLLMAAYWVTEAVPIPVTALFPVILFPLLDIMSTAAACAPYMSATNMIFVAGLIMATAIEHCNLHKRIALKVLLVIGTSTRRLLIGFMSSTAFLSMWISNTATTAMMVPILEAVIYEIQKDRKKTKPVEIKDETLEMKHLSSKSTTTIVDTCKGEEISDDILSSSDLSILRKGLFLSIAYSANIGGTGTLIGTGPNLVVQGVLSKKYPDFNDVTFASWMLYAIPGMIFCLILSWVTIYLMFLRKSSQNETKEEQLSIRRVLQGKYDQLGNISFQEGAVIYLFVQLILLLFFQDPKFIPGWAPSLAKAKIKDATPALATVIFLFIIPNNPWKIKESKPLLDWTTVQNKVPWGIIILLGGGFSLAQGFQVSGLSDWIKDQLVELKSLSPNVLIIVLSLGIATLTEITSNVVTATAFLPVVADLAEVLFIHPLFLMLPVTVACSFAFMLPIATPPNAIVYDAAKMTTKDMAIPGFIMNIFCCAVSIASIHSVGVLVYDVKTFPSWLTQPDTITTIADSFASTVENVTNKTSILFT